MLSRVYFFIKKIIQIFIINIYKKGGLNIEFTRTGNTVL